ncbi:MAG: alpha/beta fold hydrolase [Thermoplasmata archaeon]|nr:alpha/beta fold hydrolase [Thermoplasmata archaeon]
MPAASSLQIRFCSSTDRVNLAYSTTGSGYPLVRAAHYLSHLSFDLESPVWRPWIRDLSRDHELVRYDERGLGLSDWDVPSFTFDAWVRDLETVVDSLGLRRFALLGISQGGPVSIAYAARHPDRVSHLILYGAYALGWAKRPQHPEEAEIRKAMHRLMELGWGRDEPTFRQMFTTKFIPEASVEQMRWFNVLQKVSCSTENALKFDEAFSQIDVLRILPQVSVPTLILHAKDDRVVPFELGRQLAALIPGSRFVPLEGRNHILLESEPAWARFLEEIRTFVGVPAVSTRKIADSAPPSLSEAELAQARQVISGSNRLLIADFRVAGSYVRFDSGTRNALKDFRQGLRAGLLSETLGRESYLVWGPPGSGKTYLVQQIAESVGRDLTYVELNLARLDEPGFRSALGQAWKTSGPCLCLIDEIDARATEAWPYEALLPYLEPPTDPARPRSVVLVGSSASSLTEMKQRISTRPKGTDLLSRIPRANEYSVPPLSIDDKIAVVLAQLDRAARDHRLAVHEVEKLALYYVVSNPRLDSARQLREVAVRCVERLPEGEERIKYDHLFDPGDAENKEFWIQTKTLHPELINSYIGIAE